MPSSEDQLLLDLIDWCLSCHLITVQCFKGEKLIVVMDRFQYEIRSRYSSTTQQAKESMLRVSWQYCAECRSHVVSITSRSRIFAAIAKLRPTIQYTLPRWERMCDVGWSCQIILWFSVRQGAQQNDQILHHTRQLKHRFLGCATGLHLFLVSKLFEGCVPTWTTVQKVLPKPAPSLSEVPPLSMQILGEAYNHISAWLSVWSIGKKGWIIDSMSVTFVRMVS